MLRLILLLASAAAVCVAAVSPAHGAPSTAATLSGEGLFTGGYAVCTSFDFSGNFPPGFGEVCFPAGPTTTAAKVRCNSDGSGSFTYTVTGVAAGPYPGTFTETGTVKVGPALPFPALAGPFGESFVTSFEATFHIDSATAQVDGRKFLAGSPSSTASGFCGDANGPGSFQSQAGILGRYEAIIKPVTGGSFADEGITAITTFAITQTSPIGPVEVEATNVGMLEQFASDLAVAPQLLPDAKEQCKDSGFLIFGVFKNQGDCVSFVTTQGKNEPGKNNPG